MKNKVVVELGGPHDVIMEAIPVNEHQSNGVVESAAQKIGGMIRVSKLAFEQSYSKQLDVDHVLIPMLIMHAAAMFSWFLINSDGRTVYERCCSLLPLPVSVCSNFFWTEHVAERTSYQRGSSM